MGLAFRSQSDEDFVSIQTIGRIKRRETYV